MSTLATNAITDAAGGNTATINSYTPTESNMAGRNRIINGDMRIDARNAGAAVTVNSASQTFCTDRWWASGQSTDGVFTMAQSTNAPVGFSNSLQTSVTTADASIGTTQRYYIAQRIEAFNTADLGWGTASASTVALSFWVRSSLTGTFGGFIYNSDADYSYPFSYSISSADTWEYKTITIDGPTAGTWLGSTNGIGMQIGWSLGTGTDRLGTAGAWTAAQKFGATGQTNLIGTSGATFYLTGVQLEAGSVATPFEHRQYGQELALCQRYFQKALYSGTGHNKVGSGIVNSSSNAGVCIPGVTMRASPTGAFTSGAAIYDAAGIQTISSVSGMNNMGAGVNVEYTTGSGLTIGRAAQVRLNGSSDFVSFSAEL